MEAVPRLPMTSFELKVTLEKASFGQKIKQYITNFYHEDGESYSEEIHNLESLRGVATRPVIDVTGCQILKKYYCQLNFLKSRFPMEEGQPCSIFFAWKDSHSSMTCSFPDINFELACILYNIGALHSQLGALDTRSSPDGMKMACTHFQCAAWAFQTLKENFSQFAILLLPLEMILYMQHVCLAQAQECILEKSMLDNRKATIIAKVAAQVVDYYRQALSVLYSGGEEGSFGDLLGGKVYKRWVQYILFKIAYHRCVALLYQGQQSEEQQKMGERVAFYQAALDQLEEARKLASNMQNKQQIEEALVFTLDVVEGKRKAAKNENEFIYHEEVPDKEALQEVKGASLVKGISFNINDIEVSGPDIFARLVPMEAHEASSMYSEQKAQMLRKYGELIEAKDQALSEFMSSLQLDFLSQMHQANGLTQDLIDRAAALSARPNATQDLVSAMGKLSNTYHEVEAMLNEINILLQEEEKTEKEYQGLMGKRPPGIIATDLSRETAKYQEAHNKACESNQNLHKAMLTHIANLKILAMPLSQLQVQIPSVELPNSNVDDNALREIMNLIAKVEEMKTQRNMLWNDLREAVHNDDITGILATRQPDQSLDQLFQKELQKHQKLTNILEQNTAAQDNICKALVDSYARFASSRKYLQDIINKRSNTISALITSYDTYEDLLLKANKGLEFYSKLETNVTKLLGRVKSACKVQQEEREQNLLKNGQGKVEPTTTEAAPTISTPTTTSRAPKLKDYLDSMKGGEKLTHADIPQYPASYGTVASTVADSTSWPPSVRPAPLGSEVTTDPPGTKFENRYNIQPGQYSVNYMSQQQQQIGYPYQSMDATKSLADRFASMPVGNKGADSTYIPSTQQYGQYPTASYPYSADSTTVSSNQYPYIATSEQYTNFAVGAQTGTYDTTANYAAYGYGGTQYPQGTTNISQPQATTTTTEAGQTNMQQYQVPTTSPGPSTQYSNPQQYQQYQYQNQYQAQNQNYAVPGQPYSSDNQQYSTQQYQNQQQYPTMQYPTQTSYSTPYQTSVPKSDQPYTQPTQQPTTEAAQIAQYTSGYQSYYGGSTGYQDPKYTTPVTTPTADSYSAYGNVASSLPNTSNAYSSYQVSTGGTYGVSNQQYTLSGGSTAYTINKDGQSSEYPHYYSYGGTQNPTHPAAGHSFGNYGTTLPTSTTAATYGLNSNLSMPQETVTGQTSTSMSYTVPGQPLTTDANVYGPQSTTVIYSNQYSSQPYGTNQPATPSQQYPSATSQTATTYNANYYNYYADYQAGSSTAQQPYLPTNVTVSESNTATQQVAKKETNIDLLAGLDFSISQAPLVPQQNTSTSTHSLKESTSTPEPTATSTSAFKTPKPEEKCDIPESVKREKVKTEKVPRMDPFERPDAIKQLGADVEKLEKFVDVLLNKSLNGPTLLDTKWKEIQEADIQKKSISIARCYPMKNRFPDILPYDYTRVELKSTRDDYINASHIKDISKAAPPFIVTQAPMFQTFEDFWTLVWEQQVELIVCALNKTESDELKAIYWPQETGSDLILGNKIISLQSEVKRDHWIERLITINLPEQKISRTVLHFQFTAWPGSLFPNPEPVVEFVKEIIQQHHQQRDESHPILVHCSSGIGRSGLFTLLTIIISETMEYGCPLPDIIQLAMKLSCSRKNILRDREHLKFAYTVYLHYLKNFYRCVAKIEPAEPSEPKKEVAVVKVEVHDPLSTLDPLWATKRPT